MGCEIVRTLTCRELSEPETLGIDFLNGCWALVLDTEPPIHMAGASPAAWKDTRETVSPLSRALTCGSALGWTISHLLPGMGRLKALGRDESFLLKTRLINSASNKANIKDIGLNCYFNFKYRFIKENYEEWENTKKSHFLMCFKTANEAEPSGRSWKEHYSTPSLSCKVPYLFFINC